MGFSCSLQVLSRGLNDDYCVLQDGFGWGAQAGLEWGELRNSKTESSYKGQGIWPQRPPTCIKNEVNINMYKHFRDRGKTRRGTCI
jgi:hypothetical protein